MALAPLFAGSLTLPAIAAPMFLVSGPQLVIETCKAGIAGSFPALNQRTSEGYAAWLDEIGSALAAHRAAGGRPPAPFGVNLIVHKTNPRLMTDLAITCKAKVPFVITSLGAVRDVVDAVHSYGGLVLHDVISARHAEKAIEAGVDGVIAVSAGAGGHAGTINPFALLAELRPICGDKMLVLAGSISNGGAIAAAIAAGADLAYLGTRFIATRESLAPADYKDMIVASGSKDIVYTPKISGVAANFLIPSLIRAGLDVATMEPSKGMNLEHEAKAWSTVWSAGHGVAGIDSVLPVGELVQRLAAEYAEARQKLSAFGVPNA
jgi:nitronate monooxygenase